MSNEQKKEYPLQRMINGSQKKLWLSKATFLKEKQEVYFQRAMMNIMSNDTLAKMARSEAGARSILMSIGKALQMGLEIGGHLPQAYLIPFGDKVELCPTAEGFKFMALSEPSMLKKFRLEIVYEDEDVEINKNGEVSHSIKITDKKRKLIGIYCQLTELDGEKRADYITRGEIDEIRLKWSKQPNGKAWTDAFDQMAMKVAGKRFLKPYAALKEGLLMALDQMDDQEPDNRNIDDRVDDILADAIPEPVQVAKPEPEKKDPTTTKKSAKKQEKESDERPEGQQSTDRF